jgi:hypothetical protein
MTMLDQSFGGLPADESSPRLAWERTRRERARTELGDAAVVANGQAAEMLTPIALKAGPGSPAMARGMRIASGQSMATFSATGVPTGAVAVSGGQGGGGGGGGGSQNQSNNFPPQVVVADRTVEIGTQFAVQNTFNVSDLDPGSSITEYRFRDGNAAATTGYFIVNGVVKPAGVWFTVSAAELNKVFYHAGFVVGNESIGVQAFDGTFWSAANFGTMFTVTPNTAPPIVTLASTSVLSPESISIDSLITASDPDGYPITKFLLVDRLSNSNGGYFTVNGVIKPSAVWFEVPANQLSNVRYVGGQFGQSEGVAIRAFDGKFWSAEVEAIFTTTPNLFRPVGTALDISVPVSQVVNVATLFQATDADGNTIKKIRLMDTGGAPASGHFKVNGVTQAANVFFEISIDDVPNTYYHASGVSNSENFRLQVYDGRYWSVIDTGKIFSVAKPKFDVDPTIRLDELEVVSVIDQLAQSDGGPGIIKYEIIDLTKRTTSAKLVNGAVPLAEGVVHSFSALAFEQVGFRGGLKDLGREFDEVLVRAFNGTAWSDWTRFDVDTTHQAEKALLDLGSWSAQPGVAAQLTYSFPDVTPDYYPDGSTERNNFQGLTSQQRQAIRDLLTQVSTFCGLTFVEVSDDLVGGTMRFGSVNAGNDSILGYAYPPQLKPNPAAGDFFFNNFDGSAEQIGNATAGSLLLAVALHEFGHAVGLKHPDQAPTPLLPNNLVDTRFTVMPSGAALPSDSTSGNFPATHMLFDVAALQHLYGVNATYELGDTHHSWAPNDNNFRVIWDAGGIDTFNITNYSLNSTIDLRPGRYSSIGGETRNVAIAFGADIENARGGNGNDVLIGNELDNLLIGNNGNDEVRGNGGTDTMRGLAGNDRYVIGLGNGFDIIDEQQAAGRDTLDITGFGGFNDFTEDLTFRRLGRDLRIDLTIDNGVSQAGVTIRDYEFGGSRVEVLRLFDVFGEQMGPTEGTKDIDLTSVFQFATAAPQKFVLTTFTSQFGLIASPA